MSKSDAEQLVMVDVGNRHVKFAKISLADPAHFPSDLAVLRLPSEPAACQRLEPWLPSEPVVWCVASVCRPLEAALANWIADRRPADRYLRLTNDRVPIEIRVDQPERVGTDRLVAALAADALRTAERAAIVIDAGSAITVDLVAADGAFEGGAILPGFAMMATALAQQTDQLPLIEPDDWLQTPPVVGKSTVQAIRSGLFWSHVGAVRELVNRITDELDAPPELFVAGGDAETIAQFLEPAAQVVPHLVFHGILIAYRHR